LCLGCCDVLARDLERSRRVFVDRTVFLNRLRTGGGRHDRVSVQVSSSDTLGVLKRRLLDSAKGIKQRSESLVVYFAGSRLEEDDWPLEALGVCAGFDLHYDTEPTEHTSSSAQADVPTGERGFSGTALVGFFQKEEVVEEVEVLE
jgi:hypothetical protein